ncbi:hypothetical protein DOT_2002 [Desulfosporosinus sp. OT]|nr:hypothetical protein DOT_2002 [Desulfosporosinus sp. OT]
MPFNFAVAACLMSGKTWEYVSKVNWILECPNSSCATLG